MADCLFAKLRLREIPSPKVYEDDTVLAFRDIHPQAPVHILVIPKEHIESAACITASNSAVVAHCMEVIAQLGKELEGGFRVVSNCGPQRRADGAPSAFPPAGHAVRCPGDGVKGKRGMIWQQI